MICDVKPSGAFFWLEHRILHYHCFVTYIELSMANRPSLSWSRQRLESLCVQRGIRKSVPSGLATKPQLLEKLRKNVRSLPKKTHLIQQCKEMNLPVYTSTGVSGRLLSSQELFDMSHRWKGVSRGVKRDLDLLDVFSRSQKCKATGMLRRSSASRQESSDKAANTNTRYVEAFGGISLRTNNHVCSGCRRNFFDPNDLYAKLKPRGSENALLCDYISNSCSTMTELKIITILLFQRLGEMIRKEPRAYPGLGRAFRLVERHSWGRRLKWSRTNDPHLIPRIG